MSKRAEGCGQWLSAKDKRSAKLPPKPGGNGRKRQHKASLNFATGVKRNDGGGVSIQVSCSPLSPRTRKKLKNAKQSKINNYFTLEARTKGLGCASSIECYLEEGKQTKIAVKRQRYWEDPPFCGFVTETEHQQEPVSTQEQESTDQTDCKISGISFLGDSFEESDGRIQADLPDDPLADANNEAMSSCAFSPPHKKFRTSKNETFFTESSAIERRQSLFTESEPSESFHFTQWRRDQITKCKQIQNGYSLEESPCTDARSFEGETGLEVVHRNEETEISETPPFQLTQWANQQVEMCRKIQEQGDDISRAKLHHSHEFKRRSRDVGSLGKIEHDSKCNYLTPDWDKVRVKTTSNSHVEIQEETDSFEYETWDSWKERRVQSMSSTHCEESEFQFSDWVRSQIRKCHLIHGEKEEVLCPESFE